MTRLSIIAFRLSNFSKTDSLYTNDKGHSSKTCLLRYACSTYSIQQVISKKGSAIHVYLDANTKSDIVAMEALYATLDVFNSHGKSLILGLLEKQLGLPLVLHKEANISKGKIELALIAILGPDVSSLLIQEWNRKLMKAEI